MFCECTTFGTVFGCSRPLFSCYSLHRVCSSGLRSPVLLSPILTPSLAYTKTSECETIHFKPCTNYANCDSEITPSTYQHEQCILHNAYMLYIQCCSLMIIIKDWNRQELLCKINDLCKCEIGRYKRITVHVCMFTGRATRASGYKPRPIYICTYEYYCKFALCRGSKRTVLNT
jgi:hypothetical protein